MSTTFANSSETGHFPIINHYIKLKLRLWEKNLGVLHSVDSGESETGWAFMRFDVFSVADRA